MFYLCSELNCNRKYKTKNKLINHLLKEHKIIDAQVGDPIEITKENKQAVEERKNNVRLEEKKELY